MSQQRDDIGGVPEWDLADRLRKALREANRREGSDLSVEELAEELGYSRQSVGNWMAGRAEPRRAVILQWAIRTGVDAGWLETGEAPSAGRPDGGPGETADTSRGQVIDGTGWFIGTADELRPTG